LKPLQIIESESYSGNQNNSNFSHSGICKIITKRVKINNNQKDSPLVSFQLNYQLIVHLYRTKTNQLFGKILILCLLFCTAHAAVFAQSPARSGQVSNLRKKWVPVKSDTLHLDSLSLVPIQFQYLPSQIHYIRPISLIVMSFLKPGRHLTQSW